MKSRSFLLPGLLGLILALGALVRIIGIRFGLPMAYHNDEWVLVLATRQFFGGDFNPHIFLYPSLLMYIMYGVERIYFIFFTGRDDLSTLYVLCRMTVVLFGIASIYVTYELGKKLGDLRSGLLAALVLCLSPLHVINSHFATTDVPLTFFMMLTLLAILRMTENRTWQSYIVTGLFFGLTVAVKIPGAVLLLPVLIAHGAGVAHKHELHWGAILREEINKWRKQVWIALAAIAAGAVVFFFFRHFNLFAQILLRRFQVELWVKYYDEIIAHARTLAPKGAAIAALGVFLLAFGRRLWWPEFNRLIVLLAAAIAAFFFTTPYALLDYKTFLHDFLFQMVISQTSWSGMFAGKAPGYITNFTYLWADMGPVLIFLALIGMWLYFRRGRLSHRIILAAFWVYYLYIGSWKLMFDRYMVPLLPLLAIFYAGAAIELVDRGIRWLKGPHLRAAFIILSAILLIVLPGARLLYNSYLFDDYLLKTSTRKLAYDWAVEHLPQNAVVLREQYTPEVELAGYKIVNVNFTFNDSVDVSFIQRHGVDYLIVSDKLWKRPVQENGIFGEREAYMRISDYATLIYQIKPSKPHPGPEIKIYEVKTEIRRTTRALDPAPKPDSNEKSMRVFF